MLRDLFAAGGPFLKAGGLAERFPLSRSSEISLLHEELAAGCAQEGRAGIIRSKNAEVALLQEGRASFGNADVRFAKSPPAKKERALLYQTLTSREVATRRHHPFMSSLTRVYAPCSW